MSESLEVLFGLFGVLPAMAAKTTAWPGMLVDLLGSLSFLHIHLDLMLDLFIGLIVDSD